MTPAQAATAQAVSNLSAIPLILASVGLGAVGQLTMKTGFNHLAASGKLEGLEYIAKLPLIFTNLHVLGGLSMYVIATFVWFAVLLKAELSFAYPFIALAYVVTVVGSVVLFQEHLNVWKIAALALIILGVMCLAKGAQEVASGKLAKVASPDSGQELVDTPPSV